MPLDPISTRPCSQRIDADTLARCQLGGSRPSVLQIYPRSFADSDGDGVGDLDGITSRLDHVEWLGVDAIWLSPIYPSPLDDFGYDISDHGAVAPEYGGEEAFERLVAAAHARGMRVLLDLVPCHTSIEHPWFREHRDRYVWAEPAAGGGPPNNWIASFGGPAWSPDPAGGGKMYLHSFFAEQPDLDWRNPQVREAMGAMISGWIERGVDGFRVDAIDRLMKDPDLRNDPPSATPFPLPVVEALRDRDLIHSRDAPDIGTALAAIRNAAGEEAALIGEVYLPAERLDPYLERARPGLLLRPPPQPVGGRGDRRRARGRGGAQRPRRRRAPRLGDLQPRLLARRNAVGRGGRAPRRDAAADTAGTGVRLSG